MKSRLFKILAAAVIMTVAAAFAASAAPIGREAPITKDLAAYFSSYGVDPQYLGVPADKVPADQAKKIDAVLGMQDDKTNGLYPHTTLMALVMQALYGANPGQYDPVFVNILNQTWSVEYGINPAGLPTNSTYLASAEASWKPFT